MIPGFKVKYLVYTTYITFQQDIKTTSDPFIVSINKILNQFPVGGVGVSDTISPTTIMTGEIIHYKKHPGLYIRDYFQVNDDNTHHKSKKHVPKVPFAWNQAKIFKVDSSL